MLKKCKIFKGQHCRPFLNTQEVSESFHKMQQLYHHGNIAHYCIRFEKLNSPMKANEHSYPDPVKWRLNADLNCLHDLFDDNNDNTIFQINLAWAAKQY